MPTMVKHSVYLTGRSLLGLRRNPAYLLFTLVQPMVWLLLFSQLFERVVDIPGFGEISYLEYLTPGVVVMNAVMTANWAGTKFIEDMERGVMDRNLTSPVSRSALINGILTYSAVINVVQALLIFGVALLMGARFSGGVAGVLLVAGISTLLAVFFAALSCGMALLVRSQEALIGMSMMLALPLVFLSSVLMAPQLLPDWVETVSRFNPIDWTAAASREVLHASPDWGLVLGHGALLAGAVLIMGWLATRAFRTYQRRA